MATIGHREIMRQLYAKTKAPNGAVDAIVEAYIDMLFETMANGNNVSINNIGTIKVLDTPARIGRNINTGEAVDIPASKRVKLQPCVALKKAVVGG